MNSDSSAAAAAAAYKAAKEAWVTGHTGGSMTEATLVTASALTTFIFWSSIQKYHPKSPARQGLQTTSKASKAKIRNSIGSFLLDFITLVVPLLLGCTLFADYAYGYLWPIALLVFAVVVKSVAGPDDKDILKKETKRFKWRDSEDEYTADEQDNVKEVVSKNEGQSSSRENVQDQEEESGFRQRKGARGSDHAALQLEDLTTDSPKKLKPAKYEENPHKIFLSVYRASMMILTCIAILAVDFPIFPRRFGKVEVYGTSLMDLGVGSFVFSSGVVSARGYLKKETMPFVKQMVLALRTSIPLLILGVGRYISTKGVDYQEHVTEYGMHWNFFFTLGFLPIFVTFFRSLADYVRFSILGTAVAVVYQCFLTFGGLEEFIQHAPRVDIISMNKEGIFSFAGYLAIFLVGVDVGLYVLPNDPYFFMRRKSNKKKAKKGKLAMILVSLEFLLSMAFVTSYGILRIPVSRQMANLSYFFWVITFNTGYILCFLLAEIAITKDEPSALAIARAQAKANISTASGSEKVLLPPLTCPPLLEAVNRNGLAVFLFANILTGLVNLSIKTLYTPNSQALAILTTYIAIISAAAWVWQVMGWKLKL